MVVSMPSWGLPLVCPMVPLSRTNLALHLVSHSAHHSKAAYLVAVAVAGCCCCCWLLLLLLLLFAVAVADAVATAAAEKWLLEGIKS